jgi:hypothetical protein
MNSKTTLSQVLSLILVSCLILFGCNGKNKSRASDSTSASDASKQATKVKLKTAIAPELLSIRIDPIVAQGYQNANNLVTDGNVKLVRFTFKASDIDEILNKNPNLSDPPDKLVLKFGITVTGSNKTWHLIAYGMNDGKLLDQPPNVSIFDGAVNDDPVTNSIRITNTTACGWRNKYLDSSLTTPDRCALRTLVLEGFSFDIWQIQEILTRNHQGGIKPDKVAFYLGLEDPTGIRRYHIIAYGMKGTMLLNSATKASNPSVFDKADPCPPCQ